MTSRPYMITKWLSKEQTYLSQSQNAVFAIKSFPSEVKSFGMQCSLRNLSSFCMLLIAWKVDFWGTMDRTRCRNRKSKWIVRQPFVRIVTQTICLLQFEETCICPCDTRAQIACYMPHTCSDCVLYAIHMQDCIYNVTHVLRFHITCHTRAHTVSIMWHTCSGFILYVIHVLILYLRL